MTNMKFERFQNREQAENYILSMERSAFSIPDWEIIGVYILNNGDYYVGSASSVTSGDELLISSGVINARNFLLKKGMNFEKKGIYFEKNHIKVSAQILNSKPFPNPCYNETQAVVKQLRRLFKCEYEFKPPFVPCSVDELEGFVYPDRRVKGLFLEIPKVSLLEEVKIFAERLGVRIHEGEDERHFRRFNEDYKSLYKWENNLFIYQRGIAYIYDNHEFEFNDKVYGSIEERCIRKVSGFTGSNGITKYSPNDKNFIMFTPSQIDTWKNEIEKDLMFWEDYCIKHNKIKAEIQKRLPDRFMHKIPSDSPYFNNSVDLDQQSQEFWDDL